MDVISNNVYCFTVTTPMPICRQNFKSADKVIMSVKEDCEWLNAIFGNHLCLRNQINVKSKIIPISISFVDRIIIEKLTHKYTIKSIQNDSNAIFLPSRPAYNVYLSHDGISITNDGKPLYLNLNLDDIISTFKVKN